MIQEQLGQVAEVLRERIPSYQYIQKYHTFIHDYETLQATKALNEL